MPSKSVRIRRSSAASYSRNGTEMSTTQYNPEIHHRRSIRLKGHDYARGGLYFVTICAHRDAGDLFAKPAVRELVARVWRELPQSPAVGASLVDALPSVDAPKKGAHEGRVEKGAHEGCPYVIMPDHFHALVRMCGNIGAGFAPTHLGDVIGAFKSLVVHAYIAEVKASRLAPFPGKIWHRNYYETIVRTPEAAHNIAEYIRMNPWKLVQHGMHEGQSFRMIGNPALLNHEKIGVLCSRNCPETVLQAAQDRARSATAEHCFLGGFHSLPERAILDALLQSQAKLICCPAWGIDDMRIPADWLHALEANRMLILEMPGKDHTHVAPSLAAAEERNRFVLACAEKRWTPHVSPGRMLERLLKEAVKQIKGK